MVFRPEIKKKPIKCISINQERMFIIKAEKYYVREQYFEAISYATKAIRINPRSMYYVQRAFAHSKICDFNKSITDIDIAIAMEPTRVEYLNYKGYLKIKADDLEGALDAWERAAELGCEDSLDNLSFFTGKKSAWLKGCVYLNHFELQNRNACSNKSNADELPTSIERITYHNKSTYQLFLN